MPEWPLSMELLRLTPFDGWTLEQACLGTLITGGTGGGKTSGPFQYVIRSFLRAGFGGLFLCAKTDDAGKYEELARKEGRGDDVIQFRIGQHGFNFLTYEATHGGGGQAVIHNLVQLIMQASEISARNQKQDFFSQAMNQLLSNCLEVVTTATGGVDLDMVRKIVRTLPQNLNQLEDGENLFSMQMLDEAERLARPERKADIAEARAYFTEEWPSLAERTRSSIAITLSVLLQSFGKHPLRQLLLTDTTVSPDDVLAGKIVIVDVDEKTWKLVSKFAGVIWKYSVQRAIERRRGDSLRPIFIAADEAQFWASSNDQTFQTTARSSRGLSVYATQNLHNFYAEMGSSDNSSHSQVKSLLGNLQNRFGGQNLDEETNRWYAESLNKIKVEQISRTRSSNTNPPSPGDRIGVSRTSYSTSESISTHEEYALAHNLFTGLKRGEDSQGKIVESIMICAGKKFKWGPIQKARQWSKLTFHRETIPTSVFSTSVRITAPKQR
jgi:hypothetical protein